LESFLSVLVSIPTNRDPKRLKELIKALNNTETVANSHCDKCHAVGYSLKKTYFDHLPKILCIVLKRFKNAEYYGHLVKNNDPVSIPFSLFMEDFRELFPKKEGVYPVYRLSAVLNHSGTFEVGHYWR
jgi:ubiquitin C-terminal hydrolase